MLMRIYLSQPEVLSVGGLILLVQYVLFCLVKNCKKDAGQKQVTSHSSTMRLHFALYSW